MKTAKKIILVEDNVADVELTKIAFRKLELPLEIIHVPDGHELIDLLREVNFDDIALRYLSSSSFTLGYRKNRPIIFGNTKARIIASENLITASSLTAAPITTKAKNSNLNVTSAAFPFPNRNFHDCKP